MSRIVYAYFRDEKIGKNRHRDITVAYTTEPVLDHTGTTTWVVSFDYAICSPNDQFRKKTGRAIAEGRLVKTGGFSFFSDTNEHSIIIDDIRAAIHGDYRADYSHHVALASVA